MAVLFATSETEAFQEVEKRELPFDKFSLMRKPVSARHTSTNDYPLPGKPAWVYQECTARLRCMTPRPSVIGIGRDRTDDLAAGGINQPPGFSPTVNCFFVTHWD